ncbi:MAG: hypothetical protein V3W37_03210 [Candidatus Binatia bacterium]
MLRVESKVHADTITSIEQQIMIQRLKKGIRPAPQGQVPPRAVRRYAAPGLHLPRPRLAETRVSPRFNELVQVIGRKIGLKYI